ncbi:DNA-binding protein [Paraglaciecola aestuariivivens]
MARHPEVKEKEIIEAALALQNKGKIPNPGAIRAKLGFRGGLVRIRDVWAKHQAKQVGGVGGCGDDAKLSLGDLPSEIADAITALILQQKEQLEQIAIASYQRSQILFERRLDECVVKHDLDIEFYRDYELNADESISKLEAELKEMQVELKGLADQNATLLISNAKMSGQLLVFEKALPKVKPESATFTS